MSDKIVAVAHPLTALGHLERRVLNFQLYAIRRNDEDLIEHAGCIDEAMAELRRSVEILDQFKQKIDLEDALKASVELLAGGAE